MDDLDSIAAVMQEEPITIPTANIMPEKQPYDFKVDEGQQPSFSRKNYRSNSQKLTTLVELATMEDLSEIESPPKKIKKSRHKKAQPS